MHNEVAQELGARVKSVRIAQKLTQEKLAERIGKSIGLVGQIERGEAMPSVETLLDIFRVLGVNPNVILGELAPGADNVSTQMLSLLSAMDGGEQQYVLETIRRFAGFMGEQKTKVR